MKKLLLVICAMLSLNIMTAQKNVLIEEATGTWCTYCPSGIYYIDSLLHTYDNVIAIAIHTQNDPMAYNEYSNKMKFVSAPTASINRRNVSDSTLKWFGLVEEEMAIQPKSTVTVTTQFDETTRLLTAVVTVTALENINGNYTVSGVVTENAVTGPMPQYNQANIYAEFFYFPMGGYEKLPNPIPANRIAYDHVARQILGPFEGETGFPMSLLAGQSYAQTFTYYLPEEFDHNYIKVVGMLLDQNGVIDNAGESAYLNGSDNAAPKFTSSPVTETYEALEYIYNIYVHDSDDKDMVISVEQKPEWLSFEQYTNKSAAIYGMPMESGEYEVVLKVSDGETETLQSYTIVVSDPLNANWITLGERAFTSVGYGYIYGTCAYDGNVYMLMNESNFPAIYEYNPQIGEWKRLVSPMDDMGYDGCITAGTDGVYITYTIKPSGNMDGGVIKVKKYANGEWNDVGNIGKVGSVPKIAVDANNVVYVSFNDSGENNRYYVNKFINGNWENVGASYITAGGGSWARLALDSNGTPYVSWVDFYAGNLMYVSKLVGEIWLQIGSEAVSQEYMIESGYQDLAIDNNGNIYLAYRTKGTGSLAVFRFNGSEWELLGSDVAQGSVKGIDVAIDSEQNFYVAYSDMEAENKMSVVKYDGNEWSYVGQRGFTESGCDSYFGMTLLNDSPCVVYTDIAMGYKASAKYYKLTDFFYPPYNLKAEIVDNKNVTLSWLAPVNMEPVKYNVYRNNALVGNTAQLSYTDEDLESGVYNYAISAVYEDGESEKTNAVTVEITVSVNENKEVSFVMYPNPVENYLTIESVKNAEVRIYSINGQMLSQQNINEGINTIDLTDLNAGMYFISVNDTMVKVVKK